MGQICHEYLEGTVTVQKVGTGTLSSHQKWKDGLTAQRIAVAKKATCCVSRGRNAVLVGRKPTGP